MHPTVDLRRLGGHLFAGAVVTVAAGVCIWLFVQLRPIEQVDLRASAALHRWGLDHDVAARIAGWVTHAGSPVVLAASVLVVAVTLHNIGKLDLAVWLLAATAAGAVTELSLKVAIGRTRPDLETAFVLARGNSFPSGHAMNSAIVLGAIVLVALEVDAVSRHAVRLGAAVALVVVVGVGLSRPVLGVHFVSDVLAAWTLAAIWLAVVGSALPRRLGVNASEPQPSRRPAADRGR